MLHAGSSRRLHWQVTHPQQTIDLTQASSNKHMGIRQFSGRYLQGEDRLLFRLNTTDGLEYRFLLTRNVTRKLIAGNRKQLSGLVNLQHPGSAADAVVRFKQEALRQQTDLARPFAPAAQQPLGEQPVLVLDASHALDVKAASPRVVLQLKLASRQDAVFHLPQETLERMQLLLDQLQQRAAWDLHSVEGVPPLLAGGSGEVH